MKFIVPIIIVNTPQLIADRNSNILDLELQISNETPEMV